jgi:ubiquinone/menaquinone biosynthesis C-methylase UbiE
MSSPYTALRRLFYTKLTLRMVDTLIHFQAGPTSLYIFFSIVIEWTDMHTDAQIERERSHYDHSYEHGEIRAATSKFYELSGEIVRAYDQFLQQRVPGKSVLDYGCGNGSNVERLAQMKPAFLSGIDISSVAIEQARQKALRCSLKAEFSVMDAQNLVFPNETFDVVLGGAILHHLDLEKALSTIRRVLKTGGYAIFIEPLGHNPAINLYRRRTPQMRTEDEHPLLVKDLQLIEQYFPHTSLRYFNLLTFAMVPVRKIPGAVKAAHLCDQAVFRLLPFARRYAWMVLITMRKQG